MAISFKERNCKCFRNIHPSTQTSPACLSCTPHSWSWGRLCSWVALVFLPVTNQVVSGPFLNLSGLLPGLQIKDHDNGPSHSCGDNSRKCHAWKLSAQCLTHDKYLELAIVILKIKPWQPMKLLSIFRLFSSLDQALLIGSGALYDRTVLLISPLQASWA